MLVELHRPKVVKKEWERLNSAWTVETDFLSGNCGLVNQCTGIQYTGTEFDSLGKSVFPIPSLSLLTCVIWPTISNRLSAV